MGSWLHTYNKLMLTKCGCMWLHTYTNFQHKKLMLTNLYYTCLFYWKRDRRQSRPAQTPLLSMGPTNPCTSQCRPGKNPTPNRVEPKPLAPNHASPKPRGAKIPPGKTPTPNSVEPKPLAPNHASQKTHPQHKTVLSQTRLHRTMQAPNPRGAKHPPRHGKMSEAYKSKQPTENIRGGGVEEVEFETEWLRQNGDMMKMMMKSLIIKSKLW